MKHTPARLVKIFAIGLATIALIGCAANPKELTAPVDQDPWEDMNRSIYAFNKKADEIVLRPVAIVYDEVTPSLAQQGISNFFTNLSSPWVSSQLLLQGRFKHSSEQFGRFLINTVYGIGGFFDVADHNNLPEHDTDLGQTLAVWGWEESRFLMLPLLGPATVRDGIGRVAKMIVDPVDQELRAKAGSGVTALDVIQIRAGLLPFDATLAEAFDEYALVRDGWLQRRQFQLHGEDATLPDYDAFLEDDDDTQSR